MGGEGLQRRLSAILAADVVGYTRLVEQDTDGTVAAWQAACADIIDPTISEHAGRIVKHTGDGFLAEFPTVQDAVRCAITMQDSMSACPLDFRMGIDLGDIIDDGKDIHGEGVNIAARIEALADPGGICISGGVFEQIRNRLDHHFEDLGEHEVKHVSAPVRVYRIGVETATTKGTETSSPDLALPDKPSIAVLAFNNLSDDPQQEYFAHGIAEDIITELSRYDWLFVIARNTTFSFRDASMDIKEVGRRLGVHYVMEGSVRKSGNRIRITAQLIDALTGDHIWAERYDRDLTDIFEVQDEITQTVVASVPERVEAAEQDRVKRKPPENMSAYDYLLRGKQHHQKGTPEDNAEALRLLDKAIELDPEYAAAYAWKACNFGQAIALGCGGDPKDLLAQDIENVRKGLSLDENDIECHRILCELHMAQSLWEDAQLHHEKAFSLNMNDPRIVAQRGELFTRLGRADEGVTWVEKAMRLDPYGADARAHLLARSFFAAGRYADAIDAYRRVPTPHYDHFADMAACSAQLGQDEDAHEYAKKVLDLHPDFSVKNYLERRTFKEPKDQGHLGDSLLKSGLPE